METIKLDVQVHREFAIVTRGTFAELEAADRAYWWSRTPAERMEALEELRIRNYGEEAINARVQGVFGVSERR